MLYVASHSVVCNAIMVSPLKYVRRKVEQATHSSDVELSSKKATILLIGSTGNGKSTLGNFLLDEEEEIFAVATDNTPKTRNTHIQRKEFTGPDTEDLGYSSIQLGIIDTPGLNESDDADLRHMIDIVETLEKEKEIAACIFVVKFNSKIDAQYRKTIKYYSQLLPSLFEKNVFVVMTDYATDARSQLLRKRQNIDVDQIISNTEQEIIRCAKLSYNDMIVFQLDCLPLTDEEIACSKDVRSSILKYILQLQPTEMANLKVAKTERLLQMDNEEIRRCEGEIDGYKERLIELNKMSEVALNTIRKKESIIAKERAKADALGSELQEKDTSDLVTAVSWSIDTEEKFLRSQYEGCDLESPWKIANVRKWTNGRCWWRKVEQTDYTFKGKVQGKMSHGLYANVVLETERRTKYQKEIDHLKEELKKANLMFEEEEEELSGCRVEYNEYKAEIESLENFIRDNREKIKQLESASRMTISEAVEKLHAMQL